MNYASRFLLSAVVSLVLALVLLLCVRPWWVGALLAAVVLVYTAERQLTYRIATYPGEMNVPVGGGWSFFLNKTPLVGRPIYASRGLRASGRFGAGTRIKTLQKRLVRSGQTLYSYPSIENGTLGGWIASGSHGSGGTLWKPSIGSILVRDLRTQEEFVTDPKRIFHR